MIEHTSAEATGLDSELETFQDDLGKASELVVRLYGGLDRARVTPAKSRKEIASLFDEPLPQHAQPMEAILREVENNVFANSTLYLTPRFFGYINAGGNQAAILGELLASAVNQLCAKWHFSPAASEVERLVIRWIAEFIGYAPDAGGCLLSGGSAGNLVGLAVARRQNAGFDAAAFGMRGGSPVTVYVSAEGHASLEKGMVLLGIGRNQLRTIRTLDDFTIDLEALERQVAEDRQDAKAYGARKLRAAIESNIEIMRYLAAQIDQSPDLVRLAPVPLSVVCFQYRTPDTSVHGDQKYLDWLNSRLLETLEKDGRVFLSGTTIRGKRALRACSVNHRLRREDVDCLLDVIREVGHVLIATTQSG